MFGGNTRSYSSFDGAGSSEMFGSFNVSNPFSLSSQPSQLNSYQYQINRSKDKSIWASSIPASNTTALVNSTITITITAAMSSIYADVVDMKQEDHKPCLTTT